MYSSAEVSCPHGLPVHNSYSHLTHAINLLRENQYCPDWSRWRCEVFSILGGGLEDIWLFPPDAGLFLYVVRPAANQQQGEPPYKNRHPAGVKDHGPPCQSEWTVSICKITSNQQLRFPLFFPPWFLLFLIASSAHLSGFYVIFDACDRSWLGSQVKVSPPQLIIYLYLICHRWAHKDSSWPPKLNFFILSCPKRLSRLRFTLCHTQDN